MSRNKFENCSQTHTDRLLIKEKKQVDSNQNEVTALV